MKIFICDAEEMFLKKEKRICEKFFDKNAEIEMIILFISNREERMRKAIGKKVLDFVDKASMKDEIPIFLEKVVYGISERWIEGEAGERFNSRDICYIKADGKNYIRICLKDNESTLIRGSLKELEEILKDVDYIRVHREYLVNMREISELKEKAVLIGGVKIPISARKQHEVKMVFREFERKRMRYH